MTKRGANSTRKKQARTRNIRRRSASLSRCAARIADKSDALAAATNAVGGGNIGGAELTDILYSLETDKRNYDACAETCKKYAAEYERTGKTCDDALKY